MNDRMDERNKCSNEKKKPVDKKIDATKWRIEQTDELKKNPLVSKYKIPIKRSEW